MDAVEGSLRRLRCDYIDLYQTHEMDPNTPIDETMRALDDLVRAGKVRYLGCSNYSAWRLLEALWRSDAGNLAAYQCLQPRYNLLQRAEFERDMAELIGSYGLGVIPYSPLAGGTLTGKYRDPAHVPAGTRAAEVAAMRTYHTAENLRVVAALERIGAVHGKSAGQTALAWLLSNPLITAPIVGARNRDQLADSLGAAGYRLTAEEQNELNQLSDWR
jgi:aryl-alcohol dehydrogenase-like predicted oxidoreductase